MQRHGFRSSAHACSKILQGSNMDVEYMVTTTSLMETLNFKWNSHIYTHAAAYNKEPLLWCEKHLTTWLVPDKDIKIDESLYMGHVAAREAAIKIMSKLATAKRLQSGTNCRSNIQHWCPMICNGHRWTTLECMLWGSVQQQVPARSVKVHATVSIKRYCRAITCMEPCNTHNTCIILLH